MARIVSIFIIKGRQRLIGALFGVAAFLAVLAALAAVGLQSARDLMRTEAEVGLEDVAALRTNAATALAILAREATAEPCSDLFRQQLQRVALLPDGLHEFLYAPGGTVRCSTSKAGFAVPPVLTAPDLTTEEPDASALWIDRPLDFISLAGFTGSIAARGDFAVVIPPVGVRATTLTWMTTELVAVAPDGRWWHRSGEGGLFKAQLPGTGTPVAAGTWGLPDFDLWALRSLVCTGSGLDCVAVEGSVPKLLLAGLPIIPVALLFALLVAGFVAQRTRRFMARYWDFEARFRRHLGPDTIVCAYQPIVEVSTGRLMGCEVLARWRDLDDSLVFPDRFIPLVERHGLTLRFTRLVAERAHAELTASLPPDLALQINFNIFPSDLDARALIDVFSCFLAERRFRVALEIVETEKVDLARAGREIEALRAAGFLVYIDDFGTGYSSMETLAALPVDGVKLDRAFAMAPDHTVMARMLDLAVEMVRTTGRPIVIEGIESAERMAKLRSAKLPVDYAQGYHVSRPVGIDAFACFVGRSLEPLPELAA